MIFMKKEDIDKLMSEDERRACVILEEIFNELGNEEVEIEPKDTDIHRKICEEIHHLFIEKNERYGNSFSEQFQEFGLLSLIIRLSDKLNRLKTLEANELDSLDESIEDTLMDIANYAIMGLVELKK